MEVSSYQNDPQYLAKNLQDLRNRLIDSCLTRLKSIDWSHLQSKDDAITIRAYQIGNEVYQVFLKLVNQQPIPKEYLALKNLLLSTEKVHFTGSGKYCLPAEAAEIIKKNPSAKN